MKAFRLAAAAAVVLGLAGCEADSDDVVMPEVTGLQLDVALSDIERAGFEDEVEVVGGGTFGVVDESNWTVCEQLPEAGEAIVDQPRVTVDRSCDEAEPTAEPTEETEDASEEPSESSAPEPEESETTEAATYDGPEYEVVAVDRSIGPAELDQHWVLTDAFDYSTGAYKDQVKAIIADVAREEGTASLIVQVVSDEEIIEAESDSTISDYMAEHDADYLRDVLAPKEAEHWVAWYTGGFDAGTNKPSDADSAFEVVWRVASDDPEFETWRPDTD